MLAGAEPYDVVVEGIAQRHRLQELMETLRVVTRGALRAPIGRDGREALVAWGFPEPSLDRLDIGYVPEPDLVGWEFGRRSAVAAQAGDAVLLAASWSGRVVGPWRNHLGRILTFFAWEPERPERYAYAPSRRPRTLFAHPRILAPATMHRWVVEGVLDVLLASSLGMDDVVGVGGPIWQLSEQGVAHLASSGIRELTLIPPDDETGRLGVLTVLENAETWRCPHLEVSIVDPAMMAGARDLGELVRTHGSHSLLGAPAWRMDGDVYRLVMVPW